MRIRVGYRLSYNCPQDTPMILNVNVHYSRAPDLVEIDRLTSEPLTAVTGYRDGFGNWCNRLVAPQGRIVISSAGIVGDSGEPDVAVLTAGQQTVPELPDEVLIFLLGSRYCETDRLSEIAWELFGQTAPGWARVQAICDFVHRRIEFGYHNARATRGAWEAYNEGVGVCRDFAHLAVAFCRCMNIPARYCTGYLGDMGTPPPYAVMDFAAWFEAYLDGGWHTFDPRNNVPRVGRVLMARGRDAADVAIVTTFGPAELERFEVWAEEIDSQGAPSAKAHG